MEIHELPDWRIYFAAKVSDVTGPGSFGPKPGDIVLPMTETKIPDSGLVTFPVVSSYRLSLSIAIRASHEAKMLRKNVKFTGRIQGTKARAIDLSTAPFLYDYFERTMIAATFSYQALETYANETIEQQLRDGKTLLLQRRKGSEELDAESLQKDVSTEEKIATVVPMLRQLPLDKGGKMWQQFTILRRVRDSIIHLKSTDHYRPGETDRETVFYRLLKNDPRLYPRTSLAIMRHFSGGAELSWLKYAEERLEAKASSTAGG
jgi:hypothetical protein